MKALPDYYTESMADNFAVSLSKCDQVTAEAVIGQLRYKRLWDEARLFEEELQEKDWYCGECHGTGRVTLQEGDIVWSNKCICQKRK